MLQMFHLYVSKLDQVLQAVARLLLLLRRRPEADKCLRGVHPQVGQVCAGWALAAIPPCEHGMDAGYDSAV
jgi:hypothetical protein